jgi:hypothetical protein
MTCLFINFYDTHNPARQEEIEECLSRNVANPMIDRIYVIIDSASIHFHCLGKSEKIEKIIYPERPTYSYLFQLANSNLIQNDIAIISNSDIYFEEHAVSLINYYLTRGTCFALSRWDREPDGTFKLFDRADSQDSWIFRAPINFIDNCDFFLGRLGCDNAVCQRIETAGYIVQNPARDIRSIHLHNTGIRNYDPSDHSQVVERPYKSVDPASLPPVPIVNWVTEITNLRSHGLQSQYGEELIIDHIFNHIGVTNRYMLDLGAGAYGESSMSNTRKLIQTGWNGYGVDVNNKGETWIIERFITPGTILSILAEQDTPKDFDFLNLDIDSCDFWVLKKLLQEYSPRCICTEFNGTLDPGQSIVLKYEEGYAWDETNKYGYSFAAGEKLLGEYGYKIIYNMLNQNIFAVKKELVKGLIFDITATQVWYHPENLNAIWETY